jgi:tetratricopeptide (TPR) repeat protein
MKRLSTLLFALFLFSQTSAQAKLTPADWQDDLRFLQQTVHQDYPFLFKKITAAAWDAEVEKFHKEIPTMQEHEKLAGLGRMVALFGYGHTDIGWRQSPVKYHVLPVAFMHFSDGVFVEGAHKDYEKMLGAKLVKVEGMPVEQALAAIKPLVPVENEQYFRAYGLDFLVIPEALHAQRVTKTLQSGITYTLEKDGKTFEQKVAGLDAFHLPRQYGYVQPNDDWRSVRDQRNPPLYLKNLDKIYYYEYLPASKTVYVRHSQIQDEASEPTPDFYQRVFDFIEKNEVEKLVIDVRLNGGGNNFKNKPVITGLVRCEKINQPGKLFVITGKRTFSACQNLVNELDNYTNATFVGEPTAENVNFYGDNRRVDLPKTKTPVFLSWAWWQDKPQWMNADWLAPDVAVEMNFDDYRSNRDPVMEAIHSFDAKGYVVNPMEYLQQLFMENKLDAVQSEAERMVKDPRYRYVRFEAEINQAGYDLMGREQFDAAVFVMQLNSKLYPNSANAWDSLGEASWKAGQKEKAIEFYKKAIELDPKGVTGDNSRAMLKQIQEGK